VRQAGLKLTVYFGERDRAHDSFLADALAALYARHELRTSLIMRGVSGFGAHHHLRTDRLLTLSEDLPLVSVAVDTREREGEEFALLVFRQADGFARMHGERQGVGAIAALAAIAARPTSKISRRFTSDIGVLRSLSKTLMSGVRPARRVERRPHMLGRLWCVRPAPHHVWPLAAAGLLLNVYPATSSPVMARLPSVPGAAGRARLSSYTVQVRASSRGALAATVVQTAVVVRGGQAVDLVTATRPVGAGETTVAEEVVQGAQVAPTQGEGCRRGRVRGKPLGRGTGWGGVGRGDEPAGETHLQDPGRHRGSGLDHRGDDLRGESSRTPCPTRSAGSDRPGKVRVGPCRSASGEAGQHLGLEPEPLIGGDLGGTALPGVRRVKAAAHDTTYRQRGETIETVRRAHDREPDLGR